MARQPNDHKDRFQIWLRNTDRGAPLTVHSDLADESSAEEIAQMAAELAHAAVNNAIRACGLECGPSLSEGTWNWAKELKCQALNYILPQLEEARRNRREAASETRRKRMRELRAEIDLLEAEEKNR